MRLADRSQLHNNCARNNGNRRQSCIVKLPRFGVRGSILSARAVSITYKYYGEVLIIHSSERMSIATPEGDVHSCCCGMDWIHNVDWMIDKEYTALTTK